MIFDPDPGFALSFDKKSRTWPSQWNPIGPCLPSFCLQALKLISNSTPARSFLAYDPDLNSK